MFSGVCELPFGSGRRFGGGTTGVVDRLIGGWQANWNFNWQSGPVDQPGGLEPIRGKSAKLDEPTPDRWFNTLLRRSVGQSAKVRAGRRARLATATGVHATDYAQPLRRHPAPVEADARCITVQKHDVWGPTTPRISTRSVQRDQVVIFDTPNTDFQSVNFGKIATPRRSIYFPRNVQLGVKFYF